MSDLSAQIRGFDQNMLQCGPDYEMLFIVLATLCDTIARRSEPLMRRGHRRSQAMWGVDHDIQKNSEASANAAQKSDNLRAVKNQMKPRSP